MSSPGYAEKVAAVRQELNAALDGWRREQRVRDAAPDLLAACEKLVGSVIRESPLGYCYALSELHAAVDDAKAAIAKATLP